jgi:phosphonate transport system substrate-binding protein
MKIFQHAQKRCAVTIASMIMLLTSQAVAMADWRKDLGVFRIGMIESEALKLSPGELERIRSGYADALSMPVEIIRTRDFPALIDAHASARVEYAILSAAAYATAYLVCECIEPLVQPIATNAATGTRTVLFLDSKITMEQVAQSKGLAVPDKNSLNGYGVPLSSENLISGKLKGNEPWLVFAKDTDAAIQQFADGKVDGFFATVNSTATLATALQQGDPIAATLSSLPRQAKASWISNIVANGPHAVRKNLVTDAKNILSKYLVNLAQTDSDLNDLLLPANDIRFDEVNHSAYATAISATKMLAAQSEQPAQ